MTETAGGSAEARRQVRRLVATWLVWVASLWVVALLVGRFLPPERSKPHPRTPVEVLSAWDGVHYAHVAAHGYSPTGIDRLRFAFFPLLPAVSRLLGGGSHAPLAGILLSQLCALAAALLLQREERDAGGGGPTELLRDPAFWLLAGPCSFFLGAFYTESLFVLLSILFAAAWRRRSGALAGASGFLAGLARPTAITLPSLALPALLSRRRAGRLGPAAILAAAAPFAGVGLYLLYTGVVLGSPLGYTFVQRIWGQRMTLPFLPLARSAVALLGLPAVLGGSNVLRPEELALRLFSSLGVVALAVAGWRRLDAGDRLYLLVSFVFIHSQEPYTATPRYEMALFPVYRLLARSELGRLRAPLAVLLVLCQVLLLVRFGSWLWVA